MRLLINGVKVKSPHHFAHESYDITKSTRLANGDMSMDLIATKVKFLLSYDVMSTAEYTKVNNAMNSTKPFFTVTLDMDGITRSYVMYRGALKRDAHIALSEGHWVWKEVTFNFIER